MSPFTLLLLIFTISSLFNHPPVSSSSPPYFSPVNHDPTPIILRPSPAGNNRHTMFLPLFPSPLNSSRISADSKSRRQLQKSDTHRSNARMALHDDLLLNGYYTTRLWIGSPPQRFALIVDTGSTVTYVPCSTCEQCGKHQDPRFDPELSDTYKPVKCNIDCTCDNNREQCIYERQYAEMSSSSGVLGDDIVSFGNQSDLPPQRAVFGCENRETGDLYSQHADGIMGLGRGDLSIVDQLVESGVISDSFSLCYGGMDVGGGAMVLGGISPPKEMVYSHSDPVRSPYYNIELKEIHVAGKRLPLSSSVFDGKHGTVLDSGTTYAYLPEAAFVAFKDAVMKEVIGLHQIKGPDPSYNDICFAGAGSDVSQLSKTFPTVEMVFGKGQKLSLSPENYLFRHAKVSGAYCLGVFQNANDPTTLLGGIIVRNTFVMYDREHEKIGFWKTNCSHVWETLHVSGAAPQASPPSDGSKTAADISPSLPPMMPPQYILPGETEIGSITFYLSVSLNDTDDDVKSQITELAPLIAQELHVNSSQVHLLNYTSEGNDYVTEWSITPPNSAYFISKANASNIISRIAENDIHLPESYGKYQLSNWQIHPPTKRSWWQKSYLVAAVASMLALLVALSGVGIWWFLRRKQQSSLQYKPVDSMVVPEQELQPL
ncbi:putative nepenthesin [Helianthus annuus]|uniref:Nepenthesin n=1 Tax=Helianthus annuus TaxID=4232 RepID=A0A251T4J1_HELAN|nr:aspartic proteinase-like protein 2 [Helianthus annuus]KAF5791611.1 putative nepenthesin [Helianthus annuus]KAJ0535159.1 putative nepenthesin [Helianthus annuus]KAJ0543043.1 putative nepenthesin [Helianthus annuus]KAJ0708097.1 putative nepenthesin [Helianthus annuus]KAJ0712061.1 putative nepenthesin [Helianthus annuus]